jgi:type I restriction-modification system DNA methylase subunit
MYPVSFENALKTITDLVNDFKANENHYLNPSYSEADVRNDFINKFFISLGWDVRHEEQKNPYEQEVRVEKPVQIAKAQKRADYSFAIAPNFRTVKFFVEAKKPAHALENKDYYFQTTRYGWNANTPIAVLTDFEEFHIIDCRFRPDINDALNYKIEKFHYTDYADKDKLGKIYWLLSREAVIDGSIEKYVDALPKPRGKKAKGLKAVTQTIDESFLEELDEIRNDLAKSFKKNNTHLSSEELTEATQRTIDRLVFIKFLEDKLIEPNHYVSEFGKRRKAWEDFLTASRTLDAKYNGIVFKKSKIDSRNIIEPDDKTFSAICDELSHENTPYNFDAIPIHILGSIYERFLGKVVNATDKRVTIEEKPEVRKAGGVYYTPQYIVNYIVDNTVGKLIEGKTPKEISKMRFADIACGSGSFLITVFERLLDYHKRWYIENPEQAKKDGCILVEGTYRLSLKQKTKILLNNVYGVDIDQQAVEVTQLSLYLKLLEDETTATANDTWVMFKEQLLPDLNKNIVCGNSLIGTDILDQQSSLPLGGTEGGVNELKLKPMDFETVFPEVMCNGGFDAVVGNPPYLKIEHISELDREYFSNRYKSFFKRYDTYGLFVEKATELAKEMGLIGYIIPSTILNNISFKSLRKYLLSNAIINRITNLGGRVFQNVNNDTLIIIYSKSNKKDFKTEVFDVHKYGEKIDSAELTGHINLNKVCAPPNFTFELRVPESLTEQLNKIQELSLPLSDFCQCFQGFVTGSNDAFIVDEITIKKEKLESQICYPAVFGNEVGRYNRPKTAYQVIYLIKSDKLSDYPNIKKRLDNYRTFLSRKREVKLGRQPWYSLHWPRLKENYLREEKILVQAIRNLSLKKRIVATLDEDKLFADHTLNIIYTDQSEYNIRYVLAILNSTLMNYIFSKKYIDINIKGVYLLDIPIKRINFHNLDEKLHYDNIVNAVDQMLTAKKQLQQAKTESDKNYLNRKCETLDKQIDELVYQLYGLTEEEIKIVEKGIN